MQKGDTSGVAETFRRTLCRTPSPPDTREHIHRLAPQKRTSQEIKEAQKVFKRFFENTSPREKKYGLLRH